MVEAKEGNFRQIGADGLRTLTMLFTLRRKELAEVSVSSV
jgi:hypothetical protein